MERCPAFSNTSRPGARACVMRCLFSVMVRTFVLTLALLRLNPEAVLTPLLAWVALVELIEREMVLEVALSGRALESDRGPGVISFLVCAAGKFPPL